MSNESSGSGCFSWILGIAFFGFAVFGIIKWAAERIDFTMENFFIYLEQYFTIPLLNPIITWGLSGLFFGAIIGVAIAIKKLKLSYVLVLYPLGALIVLIGAYSFINKFVYRDQIGTEQRIIITEHYKVTTNSNVRSAPSLKGNKLFIVTKDAEVEVIEKGLIDSDKREWYKIRYDGKEGYISSILLTFSRKVESRQ
jgi:hypothetical protein